MIMAETPPYPGTPRWVKVFGIALVLAMYKPQGMTRYGWRKQHEERA
jgi:hypothetical protein